MTLLLLVIVLIIVVFLAAIAVYISIMAHLEQVATGPEGLIDSTGRALTKINSQGGEIFIKGERWKAVSSKNINKGARVKVKTLLDEMRLEVEEEI
ncbi:hypothetical protein KAI78_05120 [bacterium]|nr:hypothetical protein [bacterium]MCK5598981.1 hypothetical protein [bacterium]